MDGLCALASGQGSPWEKPCTEGLVFGPSREPRSAHQRFLRGCSKGAKCYLITNNAQLSFENLKVEEQNGR
jgi:hypothetical protein